MSATHGKIERGIKEDDIEEKTHTVSSELPARWFRWVRQSPNQLANRGDDHSDEPRAATFDASDGAGRRPTRVSDCEVRNSEASALIVHRGVATR